MMSIAFTLLILLSLCIGNPIELIERQDVLEPDDVWATFRMFPWADIQTTTYSKAAMSPFGKSAAVAIPNIGNNWGCTDTPGPNPVDCPMVFGVCHDATISPNPGTIRIPSEMCYSFIGGSCEAIMCAPHESVEFRSELAAARMMQPCQTTCAVNGRAGVWQNSNSTLWVEVRQAK